MQEELLTEGFKKQAEELNKEIEQLKEAIEITKNNKSINISEVLDVASMALVAVLPGNYKLFGMGTKFLSEAMKRAENPH